MLKRKLPHWSSLILAVTMIPSIAHSSDFLRPGEDDESSLGSAIAFSSVGTDAESFRGELQVRTFKKCENLVKLTVKEEKRAVAKDAAPVVLIGLTLEDKGNALRNCVAAETTAQGGDCKTKPGACVDVRRSIARSVLDNHDKEIMKFVLATVDSAGRLEYRDAPLEIVGAQLQKELDAKLAEKKKDEEAKEAKKAKALELEKIVAKAERKAQEEADVRSFDQYMKIAVDCARGDKDARDISESAASLGAALGAKLGKEDVVSEKLKLADKVKAETELREISKALSAQNLSQDDFDILAERAEGLSQVKGDKKFPDKVSQLFQDLASKEKDLSLQSGAGLKDSFALARDRLTGALDIDGLSDRRIGELKNVRDNELPIRQWENSANLYGWNQNRDLQVAINQNIDIYSRMARSAKSQEERALALHLADAYQQIPAQAIAVDQQRMKDQLSIQEQLMTSQQRATQTMFAKPQGLQQNSGVAQIGNPNANLPAGSTLPFTQHPGGIQAPSGGVKF